MPQRVTRSSLVALLLGRKSLLLETSSLVKRCSLHLERVASCFATTSQPTSRRSDSNDSCHFMSVHVTAQVKFDSSLHGTGTMNVFPDDLTPQLPANVMDLKIGDVVVAAMDLIVRDNVAVDFGTCGTVLGAHEGRIEVLFPSKRLSVQTFEIQPARPLLGGFRVTQRVKAARDILSDAP